MQVLGEYLAIDERGYLCRRCSRRLGPRSENWKYSALFRESPCTEESLQAPVAVRADGAMVFRQWYCPGCATQLDTEIALAGEEFRWNFRPLQTDRREL